MQRKPTSTKAYPKELRDKAVKLVNECGYTIEQVAVQLGCSRESVRRWKETTKTKVDPETARRMEREESELKRLRNECVRLRMENDILKNGGGMYFRNTVPGRPCKCEVCLDRRPTLPLACYDNMSRPPCVEERFLRWATATNNSAHTNRESATRTTCRRRADIRREPKDLLLQKNPRRSTKTRNLLFAEYRSCRLQASRDQKRYAKEVSCPNDGFQPRTSRCEKRFEP